MPTTPNLGLPYPAPTDTPDVPRDMGALALALDTAVDGVRDRLEAVTGSLVKTTDGSGTFVIEVPLATISGVIAMNGDPAAWNGSLTAVGANQGGTQATFRAIGVSAPVTLRVNYIAVGVK